MARPSETIRPDATARPRLIQLDILRGVAVLMVLFNHQPSVPGSAGGLSALALAPFSRGFWTGVDLFFVLSGYLIGGLLIGELRKSGRIDLKRFWIRRGFKIWPSYYLYLAFLCVVTSLFYVNHAIAGSQLQGLLVNSVKLVYLQNYFPTSRLPYTVQTLGNHTWTLAVEEHFYLLLPLLLVAASRRWRVVLPATVACLFVGCLALRLLTYHLPMDWVWDYEVTHKRIDSLFFGVFLSYLLNEHPAIVPRVRQLRGPLAVVGLALIAPMFVMGLDAIFVRTVGFTMLAVGYGCLLLVFITTEPGVGPFGRAMTGAPARAVAWVGFWSYSIYLWHIELSHLASYLASRWPGPPEAWAGDALLGSVPWRDLWLLIYLAASIGAGSMIGHLVERPMLRLRDRMYPSRTATVLAAEPAKPEPVAGATT